MHSLATKAKNIGWTRQNRNKIEEKSIIDYILTTEKISNCAKEVIVDEQGLYRMKGRKESDHNTILMEISTEYTKEIKTIKRWKLNNTDGWKNFNQQMKECNKEISKLTQEETQSKIKELLKNTIGQITVSTGKNKLKESEMTKQLRGLKKQAKKDYQYAIHNENCIH